MTGTEYFTKPQSTPEREEYYGRLRKANAGPLWNVLAELVPKEPRTPCVPVQWRYEEMRPLIMEAGQLITEKEAERRVLILENPGVKGTSCITETLYAGLQLVLPGEEAPTHRHTSSALRLVIESSGAGYTAVDGERASTPTFHYPYARSREALERLSKEGPAHDCHGVKMRFVNPANGGAPLPMIGTFIQLLPAGFRGKPYRATDATIYSVIEGSGQSRIGDTTIRWNPHDVFVVPSWHSVSHQADGEAVLFSASDRPVQQAFGIWREQAPVVP